ncbi:HugZ family protein [Prosthecomicrobium pneumaticum]|uniref:DUF2470 domain-containing protein n=1 Tax=Prosthecomicrobium pneumaticum TaxID=81895 RepID=A0A7W9FNQ9_9HYPH|nr:DUF2470 domain-containing protein [Prosthecomicrobium pneumaticum]MBB5754022.1 hypothetical protein [Prosthecomicrobium pneumaticum]
MSATEAFDPVSSARATLRSTGTATLATLGADGSPFATLVTVALTADLSPVMHLSDLAVHTKNLKRDPRASLLFVAPGGETGNPLAGNRITLTGTIARAEDEPTLRRYGWRHVPSGNHPPLADFNYYRMTVTGSHLVAGFGRIHQIPPEALLVSLEGADDLMAGEAMIVDHMNDDHADAIANYATRLLGLPFGAWRMTGCDPEGADLAAPGRTARLPFGDRAATVAEAGAALKAFARQARLAEQPAA